MKLITSALLLSGVLALSACGGTSEEAAPPPPAATTPSAVAVAPSEPPAEGEGWTCPMHRHVRAHEKGRCPECKMFLVKESELDAPKMDESGEGTMPAGMHDGGAMPMHHESKDEEDEDGEDEPDEGGDE